MSGQGQITNNPQGRFGPQMNNLPQNFPGNVPALQRLLNLRMNEGNMRPQMNNLPLNTPGFIPGYKQPLNGAVNNGNINPEIQNILNGLFKR